MPNLEEMQKLRKNILNTLYLIKDDAYAGLTAIEYEAINVLIHFIKMRYMEDQNG